MKGSVIPMMVSYDLQAGATYLQLRDADVAHTVTLSDLVMVDVDVHGEPIGVDFAVAPGQITERMFQTLEGYQPQIFKELVADRSWLYNAYKG